ncbi:uncharacterized protein [Panulirus ornatus]|uniref:uncharacterized protein n=1 Tax=Panulirus ornatus TaxID=150431 RepID=UPI003A8BD512
MSVAGLQVPRAGATLARSRRSSLSWCVVCGGVWTSLCPPTTLGHVSSVNATSGRQSESNTKVVHFASMGAPGRGMSPTFVSLLLLLFVAWCSAPLATAAAAPLDLEVTIPPLLETQPPKGEVLYTVTHDPDQLPEPFTLPCRAEALPLPSYSWLKDGEVFDLEEEEEGTGRVEMIDGEGTLVFHDPRPEDQGSYQCVAENPVGIAYSEITWVRRAVMGNFPKTEPRVVTATLGQSLSLPCTPPEGYPDPSLHWVLQTSDGGLRSLDSPRLTVDEEGTLWFSYVIPEDASEDALYACAASSATSDRQMFLVEDEEGQLTMVEEEPASSPVTSISLPTEYRMGNWVYLNVSYPGDVVTSMPETATEPTLQHASAREIIALEGDDVKLFCIFGGYPVPEVRWWRESRADVESDQLDHHGKVLVLEDLTEADMGSYYCQASNEAGESETQQFTIYVEAAPEFVVEPEVVNLPAGEVAVFNCEASGDPEPTITWLQNGEALDTHETTVVFDALNFNMKAVIACNASNQHGYVYKSVYLNVLSLPPDWVTKPEDMDVLEGEAATLTCEAYGSPDPNMTWAKMEGEEKLLLHDQDDRYDLDDNKLIIKSVDATTDGQYLCIATNKFATVESAAYIAMRGKTQAEASVSSDRVEAGDHVSLDCHIKFDPHLTPTVTWFKDDVQIDLKDDNYHLGRREFDERGNSDEDEDQDLEEAGQRREETWVLEALTVHGQDSGVYTCRVHTELDDATDDLILTVEDVPNPPRLSDVQCGERQAFLQWAPAGDNNAPIVGFVIQYVTPFHPEDWKDAENKIPATETSISVDMSPGLNYTFRVLAFNRVGMSGPSVDTWECAPPGLSPDHDPYNVTVVGTAPGTMLISWQPMEPEEHNGPDFHYKVLWRPVGEEKEEEEEEKEEEVEEEEVPAGEAEDDAGSTVAEEPTSEEGEDRDEDGWHVREIQDWEKSEVEIVDLLPYQQFEVQVEAHNAYGTSPEGQLTYTGYSGQDVPESEPENLALSVAEATDAVLTWDPVDDHSVHGLLLGYKVEYWEDRDEDEDEDTGRDEVLTTGPVGRVQLTGLKPFTTYSARVSAVNSAFTGPASDTLTFATAEGGEERPTSVTPPRQPSSSMDVEMKATEPRIPDMPNFTWSVMRENEESDQDDEGDGLDDNIIIGDTDGDGDVDEDDVSDADNDGDVDADDIKIADINKDGRVDEKDVKAADRDGDGDVDMFDIGDEDGDGDFDGADVLAADEDGDGDIDAADDDEEDTLLEDRDGDGDVDRHDVVDINHDGVVDEKDFSAADVDNDGDVDFDDVKAADKDGDGDIDAADVVDLDGDGRVDGDDLEVTDKDGDGEVDSRDFKLTKAFLLDVDNDGDIDADDVLDINNDGRIDEDDHAIADIDNDGDVDADDVKAADADGDGDVDAADVGDEDGDGDVDGLDIVSADKDGDGDIDARDRDGENILLSDRDGDGDIDQADVTDLDGDGDVDDQDLAAADLDGDGDFDAEDVQIADADGDGDVDAADVVDVDGDGQIDGSDLKVSDRDGDGDIDAKDFTFRNTLLADSDNDGDIDRDDVLDIDGDGVVDEEDIKASDIDGDGDIDGDDVKEGDKDGDNDIDSSDVKDLDGDGLVDADDLGVKDKDGDGDVDATDFVLRKMILGDTDGDGDVDVDDVLDTDGDGDVDETDIEVADIDNDGDVDRNDVIAGDRNRDGDVDEADIGDEDGDGDIDGADVIAADEDGDGDIDAADDDGESILLSDADSDGRIDKDDIQDLNGDGVVDESDLNIADVDNDGDFDGDDIAAADRDGDGDVDAADVVDVDGDGDVDGKDLLASDKDGDGDVDSSDIENLDVFLKDTDHDGDVDVHDVLDSDHDGDVDEVDIAVADVDNDGDVDLDDLIAGDRDLDGDVDFKDIGDQDGDGDIDGKDVEAADEDGDGDIDAADEGRGVDVRVNWKPNFEEHPGVDFYVQSRVQGTDTWKSSPVESRHLYQTITGLDPRRNYEIRMVARDGPYETPSEVIVIPASEAMLQGTVSTVPAGIEECISPAGRKNSPSSEELSRFEMEEPTVGAVMEETNPILWTWFIIAVMVAVTMICIVFFSMWVYSQRENRKSWYHVQLAAMMKRQETVQSVDSFASHDDDFAEYGDESMAIDLLSSVSLVTNPRHQRPPPAPRT